MHGAILGGDLNPGNGALDLTECSGRAGDGHLLRFIWEEGGQAGHGHGSQVVFETGMDILCEAGRRCSSDEESEECAGCIFWTGDMVLDGRSRNGVEVRKGGTVGGMNMLQLSRVVDRELIGVSSRVKVSTVFCMRVCTTGVRRRNRAGVEL
jgi:hypothetical protein